MNTAYGALAPEGPAVTDFGVPLPRPIDRRVRVALLTREYPPDVYGGAGEHVTHLVPRLRRTMEVRVHCFGDARAEDDTAAYRAPEALAAANPALEAVAVGALMAGGAAGAEVVHSHTWYTGFAGHLARTLYGIPHVLTAHSLEPLRPWKRAQLGNGHALSSFLERAALAEADRIIAVSRSMRDDILATYPQTDPGRIEVVHNGVDIRQYAPDAGTDGLAAHRLTAGPKLVVCVTRVTPQKGLPLLLRAAALFDRSARLVIVADSWDSPALRDEFAERVAQARREGVNVQWVSDKMSRRALVQLLSHAAVFACPSVYEPLGIVNLEAMACGIPVVASATGGIPEVVLDGETGLLVPPPAGPADEGRDADRFARSFAARVNDLLSSPLLAARMGAAGRERVRAEFDWDAVADRVAGVYTSVLR